MPRSIRPSVPALKASRSCARSNFRLPNESGELATLTPQIPNLSWIHQRYLLLGLDHSALPPDLDLESPRVGRAIRCIMRRSVPSGEFKQMSMDLAMFPAQPSLPFVPPYPGVPPSDSNTPNTAASCYVDGSRGAFDFRRYPQLYDPRAPWRGFHDNLSSLEWQPGVCEALGPVDFFLWNQPRNPGAGGHWGLHRLGELFSQRERMEANFTRLLLAAEHAQHIPEFSAKKLWLSYDMPFHDPLEWDDVCKWSTWNEGRDLLGNTLQYVAELKAFNRWFQIFLKPPSPIPQNIPVADATLMGVWASSIVQQADWEFLRQHGVPIYIITVIPGSHILQNKIVPGNVDGDERYRINSFDQAHFLKPYWLLRHKKTYPTLPDLALEARASYLPSSLLRVVPPASPPNSKSTSYLFTWHSAIYLDNSSEVARLERDMVLEQMEQTETRHEIDAMFPVTSTLYPILKIDVDRHPLLDVLGITQARDSKMTRYEERYDENSYCFHPVRLGRKTPGSKERMNACEYLFAYPTLRIEIFSEYPFPGRQISFGRRFDHGEDEDSPGDEMVVDNKHRKYWTSTPMKQMPARFAFTWEPRLSLPAAQSCLKTSTTKQFYEVLQSSERWKLRSFSVPPLHRAGTLQLHVFDDSVYEAIRSLAQLDHHTALSELQTKGGNLGIPTDYSEELRILERRQAATLEFTKFRCNYIVHRSAASGDSSLLSKDEQEKREAILLKRATALMEQRYAVAFYSQMRLFRSVRGDDVISEVAFPWHIPGGGSTCVCYPVRFSRLHGDVRPEHLLAMLGAVMDILPYDIVVYTNFWEVDSTQTIELGFRYCEDALYCRGLLHGVLVDDRYLEVNFLRYMSKLIHAVPYPINPPSTMHRSPNQRLQSVVSICAIPGIPTSLLDDAYTFERQLTTWFEQEHQLTPLEISLIKQEERLPLFDGECSTYCIQSLAHLFILVLTKLDSLLDIEAWREYYKPLSPAQSVPVPAVSSTSLAPLLRQFVMEGGMRWTTSPVKSGRPDGARGPHADKNNKKHRYAPPDVRDSTMVRKECDSLFRAIYERAKLLGNIWKPSELKLPQLSKEKTECSVEGVVKLYQRIWDWQDQCMDIMRQFRNESTTLYDFGSFEDVFSGLARLESLRGPFYTACYKALQERTYTQRLVVADT